MNRREVVKQVLDGKQPPYVPWHCGFTSRTAPAWRRIWAPKTSTRRSATIS